MNARDLTRLQALLDQADRVVPMRDIHKGDHHPKTIGLRHDVDDNPGSFDTALRMAEWEFDNGWSATYFLLHHSHYWNEDMLCRAPIFEELGHEVGIHVNALAEALRRDADPHEILEDALAELRTSVRVVGSVAHGDQLCYQATPQFVNDEIFLECRRDTYGPANRILRHKGIEVELMPLSRDWYDLEYDANWLPRDNYLSDSGGAWSQDVRFVHAGFGKGQLHILQHPDWWVDVFAPVVA